MEGYKALNAGETTVGGLMQEQGGSAPSLLAAVFAVDDTDAATAKARSSARR